MENHQSSYYSVTYGLTGLKICHYTVYKKVAKQHIWEKSFKFNQFCCYKWFTQWRTIKVAITRLAMDLQLSKFAISQYIKK